MAAFERKGKCVACGSTARPAYVPWQQHTIGCPVRSAALAKLRDRRVSAASAPRAA